MSSAIFSNCLFCGIAVFLLLPLLRHPNALVYKNGIYVFTAVLLISVKLLMPVEFSFTHTLASKNILPTIRDIENIRILKNVTIGNVGLGIWLLGAILMLIRLISKHQHLISVLSIIPEINNNEIKQILSELCVQTGIKTKPKIIQLNVNTGPFITGMRSPVIVLPDLLDLPNQEIVFILKHELEHLRHHHLFIKAGVELVTAIYWWNPIVWLLRIETVRALEVQADACVVRELSNQARLSYLETSLCISRKATRQDRISALSFSLNSNMLKYRICTAMKYGYSRSSSKPSLIHVGTLVLSIGLLLFSITFTFEAAKANPEDIEGTFTINPENSYFVSQNDGKYTLYVDGEFVETMTAIPDEMSDLSVRQSHNSK